MTHADNTAHARGKTVTTRDIARQCGVHRVTVSRALSGDPRVKPETAEQIRAVAKAIGYEIESGYIGQRLSAMRHNTRVTNNIIGVFFPTHLVRMVYYAEIFDGIMSAISESGFTIHLIPTTNLKTDAHGLVALPASLRRGDLDGIIYTLWTQRDSEQVLKELREKSPFGDKPIMLLMHDMAGCSTVTTDDYTGMMALMRHLLDLGHRHFMHSFWHQGSTQIETIRYMAMHDASVMYGLDPENSLHFQVIDYTVDEHDRMHSAVELILREYPEVTAIVAPNDRYAVQVYEILRKKGMRIPEDMSLSGFDDVIPLLTEQGNILTTVQLPLMQVGKVAVTSLIAQILDDARKFERIVLPCGPLMLRGTTGPAPTR